MAQRAQENAINRLTDLGLLVREAEGWSALIASLQAGGSGTIDGAWGSASALAAAALTARAPATFLIVLAHEGDLDSWVDDLLSFSGEMPYVFPAAERSPSSDPDGSAEEPFIDEAAGRRLRLLKLLRQGNAPRLVLTTIQTLMQPLPRKEELDRHSRTLKVGEELVLDELVGWLLEHGLTRRETVELPGEFSRRGGILDVFPPDAEHPYRLEFFGDQLESMRQFAPDTQRSLGEVQEIDITAFPPSHGSANLGEGRSGGRDVQPFARASGFNFATSKPEAQAKEEPKTPLSGSTLADYLLTGSWVALIEPADVQEQGKHFLERTPDPRGLFSVEGIFKQLFRFPSIHVAAMPLESAETTCHLRVESVERFSGEVTRVRDELDSVGARDHVIVACHNEAEQKRLNEVLGSGELARSGRLQLLVGKVSAGFRLVEPGIVVLSDHELFRRQDLPSARPRQPGRGYEFRAIDSFLDLSENDLVVHVAHGIGRYRGMTMIDRHPDARRKSPDDERAGVEEHLILEFAEGTKLYVPVSKIDLVQKYVGGPQAEPGLSKLGGTAWQRRKERAMEAVMDMASDMIELQAMREAQPGISYPPETEGQAEFEATFPYQETPDQLTTLNELKQDMERPRPMDRLVCGDVGYGKTELAVRAAFKAVNFGKQVAVLVPTTVLAEQHFRTFSGRFAEYPFVVESLSRFRTSAEQKSIVERLKQGGIDIIIGTHRIVSADVQFHDLGLVIIDEEQRFGVEHKERLKRLRHTVDVITMTATPIPRTLHLSLLGVRDISNLETPPRDRLAIETRISRFDPTLIRHAILRELNRDGQVFFVHNRVYNIHLVAEQVQQIVPEARISIAHGQMAEHQLEEAMVRFVRRQSDVLVATTIIESGLDIPNANTIFINQADQYGLADLHQLRGRVGRYKHRAYCYLLLDSERGITPIAIRRLKAIEEYAELGAGFKIAMRDMEIRGAGNILGTQQSGHIAAIGYELYCQLLENAVRRQKNQPLRTSIDVTIDIPWRAYLPRDYVPGQRLKIEVYRRLSRVRTLDRLTDFRQELQDRFGPIPESAEWLLRLHELRLLAARWHIATIHLEKNDVVFGYRNRQRIQRLASASGGRLRVVDDESAYYQLRGAELEADRLFSIIKSLLQSTVVRG